jgi:hypothetical protein
MLATHVANNSKILAAVSSVPNKLDSLLRTEKLLLALSAWLSQSISIWQRLLRKLSSAIIQEAQS